MSFGISGICILSFASIIRYYMTYCVKFFQKKWSAGQKREV